MAHPMIASAPQEPATHNAIARESGNLSICALSGRRRSILTLSLSVGVIASLDC
jgi:hypothetical protein